MKRKSQPPQSGTIKELKELVELFKDSKIAELELEKEGWRIRLRNQSASVPTPSTSPVVHAPPPPAPVPHAPPATAAPAPVPAAPAAPPAGLTITSPMVGTFYRSPDPDAPPFVQPGDVVSEGQTLCILEAMKLMNEIKAEYRCKVLSVSVENGQTVEYGQTLFVVEKA